VTAPTVEEYWAALLVETERRRVSLIRENHALRDRLSRLSPLLFEWPEYDGWAAAAREYHANRRAGR
jgi:hypothetical protein